MFFFRFVHGRHDFIQFIETLDFTGFKAPEHTSKNRAKKISFFNCIVTGVGAYVIFFSLQSIIQATHAQMTDCFFFLLFA